MGRSHGRGWKLGTALVGVLLLVATGCSKSSDSQTPLTTIFVQQFKYPRCADNPPRRCQPALVPEQGILPDHARDDPDGACLQDKPRRMSSTARRRTAPTTEDNWLHIGGDFGAVDTGASIVECAQPARRVPTRSRAGRRGRRAAATDGPPHASIGHGRSRSRCRERSDREELLGSTPRRRLRGSRSRWRLAAAVLSGCAQQRHLAASRTTSTTLYLVIMLSRRARLHRRRRACSSGASFGTASATTTPPPQTVGGIAVARRSSS